MTRVNLKIDEARRLKIAGYSYREIGEKLGVSRQRAQQYIRVTGQKTSGACEHCLRVGKILHCHHNDYRNDSFLLLCPSCHTKIHIGQLTISPRLKSLLKSRTKYESIRRSSALWLAPKLHPTFKLEALRRGMNLNDATDQAVADWLARPAKGRKK